MGYFFFIAAAVSIFSGIITGNLSGVSAAALDGASSAVELSLSLLGSLCFWGGIMEVARQSGISDSVCRLLRPLLSLVFPAARKDKKAMEAVSMNVTANLLGLGNAATPLGISAMKELRRLSGENRAASPEEVRFVVMNTASLQLLPTTVAVLRMKAGAEHPLDILPAVWFVSACSLVLGLLFAVLTFPKGKKT